jgi:hypothetical protein
MSAKKGILGTFRVIRAWVSRGLFLQADTLENSAKSDILTPDLFSVSNVDAPESVAPDISIFARYFALWFGTRNKPLVMLARLGEALSKSDHHLQLFLPLPSPRPPNIVRLLRRDRYNFLDYGVHDTFYDVPEAAAAALKLEREGIYVLGQLLQMVEDDLRAFSFMDEASVSAMKRRLATIDLTFGMRAPAWNRSYKGVFDIAL